MNIHAWISKNTSSLKDKTVAITGTTGGIGVWLCEYIVSLGASLILLDRNEKKQIENRKKLLKKYPDANIKCIKVDLSDIHSVKLATEALKSEKTDIFIHNAGAYSIPRYITDIDLDNVFQINFASPYYMIKELLPSLSERGGRVVAVGSIAHNYSKSDVNDIDFRTKKRASLVYGNAKRYLMFSLYRLFENQSGATLSVAHPGITFTNITDHYPKVIYALIKNPMKVIFMKPKTASLSILRGVFEKTDSCEWIGPRIFNIWCAPTKRKLKTAKTEEIDRIFETAEKLYKRIKSQN